MVLSPYSTEAASYALRGITGTDSLALREVARLNLFNGKIMLDLGCGAGRSSELLRTLGADVVGVDVSPQMLEQARRKDPGGKYVLTKPGQALPLADATFDAFFSSWALLEMGDRRDIVGLLRECARVVRGGGAGVIVTNTPEFYWGNWVSSDVDFPENRGPLTSGQPVRARLLPQGVVVNDFFWSDDDYKGFFTAAGMRLVDERRPLAVPEPGMTWKDETRMPPHVVYVLRI